jgi:hypothetical protein
MFPVKESRDRTPHSLGLVEQLRISYAAEFNDKNAASL